MMPLRDFSGTLVQYKRIEFVVVARISIDSGPEDGAKKVTELLIHILLMRRSSGMKLSLPKGMKLSLPKGMFSRCYICKI